MAGDKLSQGPRLLQRPVSVVFVDGMRRAIMSRIVSSRMEVILHEEGMSRKDLMILNEC